MVVAVKVAVSSQRSRSGVVRVVNTAALALRQRWRQGLITDGLRVSLSAIREALCSAPATDALLSASATGHGPGKGWLQLLTRSLMLG